MNEKISDESIRIKKIEKLKVKILSEIDKTLNECKVEMLQNIPNEDFDYCVKQYFSLLKLKEYIQDKNCFMTYTIKNFDDNLIVYFVSDDILNIWLQESYSFVLNFLEKVDEREYNNVFSMMNDRYFGYGFTGIFDIIEYNNKENN